MPDTKMVKIADYCSVIKGKIGIKKAVEGEYPLVTTAEERLRHNEYHFDRPSVIIPLVSSTGHGHASLKRIHYQEGKFAVGSILCAVTPKDEKVLNAQFLYHYLDVYKEKLLVSRMKGMANVTLPVTEIADVEFPLLSTDKQKEWVSLFENTSSYTKSLTSEIDSQQSLLRKLRHTILQLAVQGKLAPQDSNDEPSSELLKRINTEKAKLISGGKIKKEKPLPPIIEDETPYELANGWEWERLGNVTQINPRNNLSKDLDVSFVPMTLIEDGFRDKHKSEVRKWGEIKLGFTHFKENDVVVAKITPCFQNRKSAVMRGLANGYGAGTTELYVVRAFNKTIDPEFLLLLFKTNSFIEGGVNTFTGTAGQQRVKKEYIHHLVIGIPPSIEQKRIVAKTEKLFTYCDELELQTNKSQQDSELLMQAVLQEAFEGNNAKKVDVARKK